MFEAYDAFICPAIGVPALEAGVDDTEVPLVVDYRTTRCARSARRRSSTWPVGVPCRASRRAGTKRPACRWASTSAGRTYEDPIVFRIGAAIEAALRWPQVAGI